MKGWWVRTRTRARAALRRLASTPTHSVYRDRTGGWRLVVVECVEGDAHLPEAAWTALLPILREVRRVEWRGDPDPLDHPRLSAWTGAALASGAFVDVVRSVDAEEREVPEGASLVFEAALDPEDLDRPREVVAAALRAGAAEVRFLPAEGARESGALGRAIDRAREFGAGVEISVNAFSRERVERPVCDHDPRDAVYVRVDGTVGPCGPQTRGERGELTYGLLMETEFKDLWDGPPARSLRAVFDRRMRLHEQRLFRSVLGTRGGREKAIREGADTMPPPPDECADCPWLYDRGGRDPTGSRSGPPPTRR
jgi:hypothetical protein